MSDSWILLPTVAIREPTPLEPRPWPLTRHVAPDRGAPSTITFRIADNHSGQIGKIKGCLAYCVSKDMAWLAYPY